MNCVTDYEIVERKVALWRIFAQLLCLILSIPTDDQHSCT